MPYKVAGIVLEVSLIWEIEKKINIIYLFCFPPELRESVLQPTGATRQHVPEGLFLGRTSQSSPMKNTNGTKNGK